VTPTETGVLCERLEWDSEHFGLGVARVLTPTIEQSTTALIDEWCEENGVRCLYFLADTEDAESSRVAAQCGFRVVDVRITVHRSLAEDLPPVESVGVEVAEASETQLGYLRSLAASSYRGNSRFYFDGEFPPERCDALYEAWIDRGFDDPERTIMVANLNGEPVGYQVVGPPDASGDRWLELLAVDPHHHGAGIAGELITETMRGLRGGGAGQTGTNLSTRNIPSMRLHEHLGFLIADTGVWHHKWYAGR
jgi:dTDP-4-amino-4,6-dideoxy-D-galactose acyltransferase